MEQKKNGFDWWRSQLHEARYIAAPMVDCSELPFRLLCRKYGANLCYTPMLHAKIFVNDHRYRQQNLVTCSHDRPLIVQFCCNDSDTFVEAVRLAAPFCDAVDINLGCPQAIAKRGHYGAFLQDEWELVYNIIKKACDNLDVPITCKVRIFPEIEKTIRYAQMLESAGCQLITVHGRTRDQKGWATGLANWDYIKAVKENVNIPVFANGNIQCLRDVEDCIKQTSVDGVMSAEGLLHNPALFKGIHLPTWVVAQEYFEFVKQYSCPLSYIRGHLFKLFHHCLLENENKDVREQLCKANNLDAFQEVIVKLRNRYEVVNEDQICPSSTLPVPISVCQPYFRPSPADKTSDVLNFEEQENLQKKRIADDVLILDENGEKLSKNKIKKLNKPPKPKRRELDRNILCANCPNYKGMKCDYQLCKLCCKRRSFNEVLDCNGHKFLFKTKSKTGYDCNALIA